jgi:hypothetical protein
MNSLVTFETIVPGRLAPRRATGDAAGRLSVLADRCSEPVSAGSYFDAHIVHAIRLSLSFLDRLRLVADLPHGPGYLHLDRIIKADQGMVEDVPDNASPHRLRGVFAAVARRPRAGDRL